MIIKNRKEDYEDELESILDSYGYILVDFMIIKGKASTRLKVTIDKCGGVSHKDCQKAAKLLEQFTQLVGVPEGYSLEISSPGIGRHLKSLREFNIFKGREVLLMYEKDDKIIQEVGQLQESNLKEITLLIGDQVKKSFLVKTIRKVSLSN